MRGARRPSWPSRWAGRAGVHERVEPLKRLGARLLLVAHRRTAKQAGLKHTQALGT